jgi:hypothetical protein
MLYRAIPPTRGNAPEGTEPAVFGSITLLGQFTELRKMKISKFLLAVIVTIGLIPVSHAKVTALGELTDSVETFKHLGTGGSFTDYVTFSLPTTYSSYDIAGLVLALDIKGLTTIKNFSFSLEKYVGSSWIEQAGFTSYDKDGPIALTEFFFSDLLPGSYKYVISGKGKGLFGGIYSGGFSVAPVPEAETWAMLIAGAALVLFQLRRKQRMIQMPQLAM